jgi:2-polyprenyl-3-methyl-5-hydroxy-6-metoxy-1,4-benzoquinol methylase
MQPDWPPWTCPVHRALVYETDGELQCPRGHAYHVVQGIPRFVEGSTYSDAFGLQWKRHRRTQLDSFTGTTLSRDRARRCLGSGLFERLEGIHVLEAGCGAGRFTEVLLAQGARVTSVDLSDAVEANQENFPQNDRHRIAQADMRALPFEPRSFHVVFCLGVVQHTPVPECTIAALYDQVRPGGWLVFDHYRHRLRWWLSTAPLFRAVLKRMPPDQGLRATDWLVRSLLPIHRRAHGLTGTLLRRISPVQTYYHAFPELSSESQRDWAYLDTHDALTDWYKHFRTPSQIAHTLRDLGLVDIWVGLGGNGLEARGRRPAQTGDHGRRNTSSEWADVGITC